MIVFFPRLGFMWNSFVGALCHASVRNADVAQQSDLWYNLDKVDGEAKIVRIGEAK